MRLTDLEIKNFRGIKHTTITFPLSTRILCLIGPGDSGKTSLLSAIEWVLWPSWNLNVTDTDFYNGDISNPIEITASITEFNDVLIKEDKYGLYLRDLEKSRLGVPDDEPTDTGITVLTIQLVIDETLEPKWYIITGRTDPKIIAQNDRKLFAFGVVGFDYEKDFLWGRSSILQKYSDSRDTLHNAFKQAMRTAVENTNLEALDEMTPVLVAIGQEYGINFNGEVHNRLLMQNGSYSTTVGLFDDKVPFNKRGLGSKRLLSIGMNVRAFENGTLVVVDEVETGLEPYRIITLINQFRTQFKNSGQLIMTTHSRSVVCECGIQELCVVKNVNGEFSIQQLNTIKDIQGDVQGIIRGEPDAFLSKRIIVCEGKTEIGLLRALDEKVFEDTNSRFAYHGVSYALGGGGGKSFKLARLLNQCGYICCILMDSDKEKEETEKDELRRLGVQVFSWEKGNAIEEQIFMDASIECAEQLLAYAVELEGIQKIEDQLNNEFRNEDKEYKVVDGKIYLCGDKNGDITENALRRIGSVAKEKNKEDKTKAGWFKRIDRGQKVGEIIFSSPAQMDRGCYFNLVINGIKKWVSGNEE